MCLFSHSHVIGGLPDWPGEFISILHWKLLNWFSQQQWLVLWCLFCYVCINEKKLVLWKLLLVHWKIISLITDKTTVQSSSTAALRKCYLTLKYPLVRFHETQRRTESIVSSFIFNICKIVGINLQLSELENPSREFGRHWRLNKLLV